ncbi:TPA: type II secretion system minor pseudopilin GspI [Burkholderia vietnamiensis]|nr:type II secretion system minor pseudopilin GspI [Burkholderia vietnamiensis]HDR9231638.1 type II secretion system minor pseudopilin GspI [Burkholderia vietnamiensis]
MATLRDASRARRTPRGGDSPTRTQLMCDDRTDTFRAARASRRGFTLIEVLIALAIVAVALGAVMRAIGVLAADTDTTRMRLLALWSADNALGELRIASSWPDAGTQTFACPQGRYRFVCRQSVATLPSPLVRRVTVSVYPSASSATVLAEVVTVIQNEARR